MQLSRAREINEVGENMMCRGDDHFGKKKLFLKTCKVHLCSPRILLSKKLPDP